VERIDEIEQTVKHDVIAFLTSVSTTLATIPASSPGADLLGRARHLLAMLLAQASDLILDDIRRLMAAIKKRAFEHKLTPMIGRSHGIHAEPSPSA